jgi:hypothetical protein
MRGDEVDRLRERAVETRGELGERGGFGLEKGAGGLEGSGHGYESIEFRVWSMERRHEGRRAGELEDRSTDNSMGTGDRMIGGGSYFQVAGGGLRLRVAG